MRLSCPLAGASAYWWAWLVMFFGVFAFAVPVLWTMARLRSGLALTVHEDAGSSTRSDIPGDEDL